MVNQEVYANTRKPKKNRWHLVDPTGKHYKFHSLRAFAKEHFGSDFMQLVWGIADIRRKRRKTYQGWELVTVEPIVPTIKTGGQFGVLQVLEGRKSDAFGHVMYECQCICGKIKYYYPGQLNSGEAVSCGCKRGGSRR